jgi:hypothetical protein
MKPRLKLFYLALERASRIYADTGSSHAREHALELIADMRLCLDDIERIIYELADSETDPNTGKLEKIR